MCTGFGVGTENMKKKGVEWHSCRLEDYTEIGVKDILIDWVD
jgi:hypothetical protein